MAAECPHVPVVFYFPPWDWEFDQMEAYNIIDPFLSSGTEVWALSPKGSVYRRYGITNTNFIGDYWKKIPGSVKAVTGNLTYSFAQYKVTYMLERIVILLVLAVGLLGHGSAIIICRKAYSILHDTVQRMFENDLKCAFSVVALILTLSYKYNFTVCV
jgi:hypothetical protein